jgi:hypothetical protein
MDLLEHNARILSVKRNHMNNTIKYKKVVIKIISLTNIPEVIYKFILNYIGSSKFPDHYMHPNRSNYRTNYPRSFPKNNSLSHQKMLEETPQEQ